MKAINFIAAKERERGKNLGRTTKKEIRADFRNTKDSRRLGETSSSTTTISIRILDDTRTQVLSRIRTRNVKSIAEKGILFIHFFYPTYNDKNFIPFGRTIFVVSIEIIGVQRKTIARVESAAFVYTSAFISDDYIFYTNVCLVENP